MKKVIALALSLLFCANAFAGTVKEIVFFGDSMTDNGNLYSLIKTMPKSPPYFKGRFTNGPTWAEDLEQNYYNKYFIASQNYAYGGATAILHSFITDRIALPITLSAEMYEYYLHSFNTDKSDVLFSIWIGANDYLFETSPDMDQLTSDVVNSIADSIRELIGKGAQNFLIINLPDLSRTPYAANNGIIERLHTITLLHNQKLAAAIDSIRAENSWVKIAYLDVYSDFKGLADDPRQYNATYNLSISNTTEACWLGSESLLDIYNDASKLTQTTQEISTELSNTMKDGRSIDTQAISRFIMSSPDIFTAYSVSKSHDEGLQPCANMKEHLFWDDVHPTYLIHEVVAKLAAEKLDEAGLYL